MSNNYKNTFIWTSEMTLWVNKLYLTQTLLSSVLSHGTRSPQIAYKCCCWCTSPQQTSKQGNENILTEKQNIPFTLNVYFSSMSSGSYRCLPGFCLLCFKCCLGLLHEYNVARLFSMSDLIFFCCCFRTWESISHWLRQDIFFSNFLSYLIQKSLLHFLRKSF